MIDLINSTEAIRMTMIIRKRGESTRPFPRKQEFVQKVRECQELARQQFPEFNLLDSELPVVFVEKGTTAGMAKWKRISGGRIIYNVEFSIEALTNYWDDMTEDTIPHEMAHIVDFVINGKSNNHNKVWQRIAHRLGCSGQRTHSYQVTKARQYKKFVYVATCGTTHKVGTKVHNKIQRGVVYSDHRTGGKLTAATYTGKVVVA